MLEGTVGRYIPLKGTTELAPLRATLGTPGVSVGVSELAPLGSGPTEPPRAKGVSSHSGAPWGLTVRATGAIGWRRIAATRRWTVRSLQQSREANQSTSAYPLSVSALNRSPRSTNSSRSSASSGGRPSCDARFSQRESRITGLARLATAVGVAHAPAAGADDKAFPHVAKSPGQPAALRTGTLFPSNVKTSLDSFRMRD